MGEKGKTALQASRREFRHRGYTCSWSYQVQHAGIACSLAQDVRWAPTSQCACLRRLLAEFVVFQRPFKGLRKKFVLQDEGASVRHFPWNACSNRIVFSEM